MTIKKRFTAIVLVIAVVLTTAMSSFAAWDGYVEKGTETGEVVIVDMNNMGHIYSSGGAPSKKHTKSAPFSLHWGDHTKTTGITFRNVPRDWTGYESIKVDIYSEVNTNAMLMITVGSELPEKNSVSTMSYFSYRSSISWTGWKTIEIKLNEFSDFNQSDFSKVTYFSMSASGWGNSPDPRSDLYVDSVYAVLKDNTAGEQTIHLSATTEGKKKVESAKDNTILAYNFSRNVYNKGNIAKLDSKLSMANGNSMAPISFFENILGAKVAKNGEIQSITLNGNTITLAEDYSGYSKNGDTKLFETTPFTKNEVLYLPLVECVKLLGGNAKSFDLLTVIGNEDVISMYEGDESLISDAGILVAAEAVKPETVTKADWDKIKKNWRRSLVGDENNDLDNQMVVDIINRISKTGQSTWKLMDKKSNILALFGTTPVANSGNMTSQYEQLEALAVAYGTYGSELYMDKQLKKDILFGLEWGYQNLYGDDEMENKGWRDTSLYNWWDWSVGVPEALGNVLMIMAPEMKEADIAKYLAPARKFLTNSSDMSEARSYIGTILAVLAEDVDAMNTMVNDYNNILEFRETGALGFRKDFTYITHSYFPYNGQYGVGAVLDRIGRIQPILTDTVFEFATPYIYNTALWFYHSFEPILYKGGAMVSFNGRYPMNEAKNGATAIGVALEYIGSFGPDDDQKLKDMIRRNVTDETLSVIKSSLTVNEATILSRVLSEEAPEPETYTRAKVYAQGDRVVQHRNGYAFNLSMSSERIATYETSPGANVTGWYLSDGMVYMYADSDLNQYRGMYWQSANPYHRPGTTVDTQEREAVEKDPYLPDTDFVGAVEFEGEYATAAMELKSYGNGAETDHNSTLNAKKSWFLFDDELVALGTDINANDGFDVHTVVENRRLNKELVLSGEESNKYDIVNITASDGQAENPIENSIDGDYNTRWSALDEAWAILELEDVKKIGYIGIAQYDGAKGNRAVFDLDVSVDGENWTTVWTGTASGTTTDMEPYDLKGVSAKYIRYSGHGREKSGWNSITEFAVFAPSVDGTYIMEEVGVIPGAEDITVNGEILEKENSYKKTVNNPSYIHLEDVGGYYFPQGGKLAIEKTASNPSFLEMWFEHGKSPKNGAYAYALLPHKTSEETKVYAENADISVLSNTPKLQAVKENTLAQTGIVFWEKGTFGEITVSEPMIVMTQEKDGEYILSFCDPTQKLESAVITLNKALTVTSSDKELKTNTTGNTITINADLKDSKGKTFTVRFKAN